MKCARSEFSSEVDDYDIQGLEVDDYDPRKPEYLTQATPAEAAAADAALLKMQIAQLQSALGKRNKELQRVVDFEAIEIVRHYETVLGEMEKGYTKSPRPRAAWRRVAGKAVQAAATAFRDLMSPSPVRALEHSHWRGSAFMPEVSKPSNILMVLAFGVSFASCAVLRTKLNARIA